MVDAFCILVVDDETDIRRSIRLSLEVALDNIEVLTASNGEEGLEQLRKHSVHMILSDYKMPLMDGLKFLGAAQKEFPDIPRIMLTAFPDPKLAAKAVDEAGVGLFVSKPFHVEYLVRLVEAMMLEQKDSVKA